MRASPYSNANCRPWPLPVAFRQMSDPAKPSSPGRSFSDPVSAYFGLVFETPELVRMPIGQAVINGAGILSGVATYAMVDYCMGSALWAQIEPEQERIATVSISINYVQTAVEGEALCRTSVDRRNRTLAVMRSSVEHTDGRLLATAIGNYSIFPARRLEKFARP